MLSNVGRMDDQLLDEMSLPTLARFLPPIICEHVGQRESPVATSEATMYDR